MSELSAVRPVVVRSVVERADGVRHLVLASADGAALPEWEPGAHIDVILPSRIVRQYSLCGSPADRSVYEIAVLLEREGRGGSAEVHSALRPGDEISIAGPRNRFPLHEADSYVFVAGGIGITPLLPMIEQADRTGRQWKLAYGGRTRQSMAFLEQLEAWGDRVEILPQDEFGLLDLDGIVGDSRGGLIYCCGPEPLLTAIEAVCERRGMSDALNIERFAAADGPELSSDGTAFEVQLGEGGPLVSIPADQSILQTLLDADVDVLYSCEEGTCGSCETQVLDGTPDHRDSLLSDESREMGCMLICVSRSCSPRLVLDVEAPAHLATEEVLRHTTG